MSFPIFISQCIHLNEDIVNVILNVILNVELMYNFKYEILRNITKLTKVV